MNGPQALARIRKLIGKRAEIYDYKKPSSPEQREAERAARLTAKARKDMAEKYMAARREEILAADEHYQTIKKEYDVARKALDAIGYGHYHRYSCGTNESIFFSVKAEADSLAELVDAIKEKQAKAAA